MKAEKRGRGRPRVRPEGVRERKWWATDQEYRSVSREAEAAGLSVQELVRRRVLSPARAKP